MVNHIFGQTGSKVIYEEDQCLLYLSDSEGNRIPNFSQVGYRLGNEKIPDVPVVEFLQPIEGDNTQQIQDAINRIAELPLDSLGVRGCLQLSAGEYPIYGSIHLPSDGIVLRGTYDADSDSLLTTLVGIGNDPNQRDLIIVGGNSSASWKKAIGNSRTGIINSFLPAGSMTLEMESLDNLQVGSKIIIHHPSTEKWLNTIRFGDTDTDEGWSTGEIDLLYNRRIIKVYPDENKILIDAPIYDHLDRSLAQSEIYLWNDQGIVRNSGVENLQIVIETTGPMSEDHIWTAIFLQGVEDCWVKKIEARHFGYAAINMSTASRVTIESCRGLSPHSLVDGSRRYNFAVNSNSNNILFSNCEASFARHAFISNGASTASGIVFHNCRSSNDLNTSEGHRRWSQGLLFDNITFITPQTQQVLGLYNRGSYGTGHGWGTVHSVAWNVSVTPLRKIIIQKPPGRQNYGIGCHGLVSGSGPFSQTTGYIEPADTILPASLYLAQRQQWNVFGPPLDAPSQLTVIESNADFVKLAWQDISAEEIGYLIQTSTDGLVFEQGLAIPANTTEYEWKFDSSSGPALYFRISAMSEKCPSAYSNVIFNAPTTGNILASNPRFKIFPNPTSESIQIISSIRLINLKILNFAGKTVAEENALNRAECSISLTNILPGIYFIHLTDQRNRIWIERLIKI